MVALVQAIPKQISVQPGWKDGWISQDFTLGLGFYLKNFTPEVDFSKKYASPRVNFFNISKHQELTSLKDFTPRVDFSKLSQQGQIAFCSKMSHQG